MHHLRDPCTTQKAMTQSTKNSRLPHVHLPRCFRSAGQSKAASRYRSRARKHGSVVRLLQLALLASRAGKPPRVVAGAIADRLQASGGIQRVEVAGRGLDGEQDSHGGLPFRDCGTITYAEHTVAYGG